MTWLEQNAPEVAVVRQSRGPERRRTPFVVPLDAVETASPTAAVDAFAQRLAEQVGAEHISFLITDFAGRTLARLTRRSGAGGNAEEVSLADPASPYTRAVMEQRVQVVELSDPDTGAPTGVRVLAPVTARGDAIGVLELTLPHRRTLELGPAGPHPHGSSRGPDQDTLDVIADAAHALAYVVTTERRHTDLYEWGRRSQPVSLAAEIQRQLLPRAFTCEAEQFTLAAWLEPAGSIGGDTFDYALDLGRLHLSLTDAMGHDLDAALLATLAVGSLRNSRRSSDDLAVAAATANRAIHDHQEGTRDDRKLGFVTGLLAGVDLASGVVDVVDAGHPLPLLVRGDRVVEVPLDPDLPLGVLPDTTYRVQHLQLQPGDRLVLLTDGMLERNAEDVDLPALLLEHAHAHPRELMQVLTAAVHEASGDQLVDDATAMCLTWHGTGTNRSFRAGASRPRA